MPTSPSIARGVAAATAGLLVAGLVTASPATAVAHHRGTTFLHTTRHHTVVAPATIRPGVARLHNSGKEPVLVLGSKSAAGASELVHDLSSKASSPKRLLKDFAVRDEVEPHQTVYLTLGHGTLYLVDTNKVHLTTAAVRTVRVTGRTSNAAVPASRPVTITANKTLHAATTLPPGGLLHVMNHSAALEFVNLGGISSSVSKKKLAAFAAHPTLDGLLDLPVTSFVPVAVLSGHHGVWTTVAGRRGSYGLLVYSLTSAHEPGTRLLTVT